MRSSHRREPPRRLAFSKSGRTCTPAASGSKSSGHHVVRSATASADRPRKIGLSQVHAAKVRPEHPGPRQACATKPSPLQAGQLRMCYRDEVNAGCSLPDLLIQMLGGPSWRRGVARRLLRRDLPLQSRLVGQAPVQALPGEHGQLDLGHVQPVCRAWACSAAPADRPAAWPRPARTPHTATPGCGRCSALKQLFHSHPLSVAGQHTA